MSILESPHTRKCPEAMELAVDVGNRVRGLRCLHCMTQETLAERMGLTFQQIQKYEKGTNSLSIYRMLQLCEIFNVDWSHFLDPRPEPIDSRIFAPRHRTTIEMLEAFEAITNGSHRRLVISLAESLADKQ